MYTVYVLSMGMGAPTTVSHQFQDDEQIKVSEQDIRYPESKLVR